MNLRRYLASIFLVACIGVSYAHLQFLITKSNYIIRERERKLAQLLDRNKKLMYNVTALESPSNLEAKLCENGEDYEIPRRWALVKKEKSAANYYELAKVEKGRSAVFERILSLVSVKADTQDLGR